MNSFEFGEFRWDGARRLLFKAGRPLALAPKALELLELLIAERARTVGKTELLERLWPDTAVSDNNLTVTMSALRKALGESAARPRYLQTLSRRGYRFVEDPPPASHAPEDAAPSSSSPARLRRSPDGTPEVGRDAPPLVGRDAQLDRLARCWEQAQSGCGSVLFVTGEPGIGKTALCEAFLDSLSVGGGASTLMRGRALEQFGRGEAYLPILEAWSALLGGPDGERACAVLRRVAPSWCCEFPALFGSAPVASRSDTRELSRLRLLREMADALTALAVHAPVLLILEDLHWADAASCDLLRWLAQRSRKNRWLVIGTFRPVEAGLLNPALESLRREALAHSECEELRLDALDREHVAACLARQFRRNAFPVELAPLLYRKTEGHPLFLVRLLSYLVQGQGLIERDGVWTLACELERLELETPEDVRGMVQRKLASLDDEARSMLAHASVEGHEFSSRVLADVFGLEEIDIEERLQPLCTQHRLVDVLGEETWPDGHVSTRYRFAHALYQNELYRGLVGRRRGLLHLRTAEVLLAHSGPERSRLAATLAVHFERGRDFARAIEFADLAGKNARRLCAYAEEERLYRRALDLCGHLPQAVAAERRGFILYALAWALYSLHPARRAAAEQTFQELLAHARAAGLQQMECMALDGLCAVTFLERRLDESRAFAELHHSTALAQGNLRQELHAVGTLMGTAAAAGRFAEVESRGESSLPAMERLGDPVVLAVAITNVGWRHAYQSRFALADAAYTRALGLWRNVSSTMSLEVLQGLGWVRAQRGQLLLGLATFAEAADLARLHQEESHLLRLPDGIGWIRRELGDYAGASAHHRDGISRGRSCQARFLELRFGIELARDALALGDLDQAGRELALARELLSQGGFQVFPCDVRRAQLELSAANAEYALARGDTRAATEAGHALFELALLDPSPLHQAQARELLARAALQRGAIDVALGEITAATELIEVFAMPLVAWRVHARAAEVHATRGADLCAERAARAARAQLEDIAAALDEPTARETFRTSPPVRRVLDAPAA